MADDKAPAYAGATASIHQSQRQWRAGLGMVGGAAIAAAPATKEPTMPKLTDSQLVILATAAERQDGAVLPPAKSLKLNTGAVTTVLKSLLKRDLLAERPADKDDAVWREADGRPMTLAITDAGREAIGVEPEAAPSAAPAPLTTASAPSPAKKSQKPSTGRAAPKAKSGTKSGTKQEKLIALLRRKRGATIAEVGAEIGWQDHSIRGAISGDLKKKRGLAVTSEVENGRGRVYRIAE